MDFGSLPSAAENSSSFNLSSLLLSLCSSYFCYSFFFLADTLRGEKGPWLFMKTEVTKELCNYQSLAFGLRSFPS